jgi:hypothetical protein
VHRHRLRTIGFVPSWLPVCRCLQDQGLREFRCALFHPDFFLFRGTPWPLKPEEKYNVKWTLVPLGQLKGVLEVSEGLGFKARSPSSSISCRPARV